MSDNLRTKLWCLKYSKKATKLLFRRKTKAHYHTNRDYYPGLVVQRRFCTVTFSLMHCDLWMIDPEKNNIRVFYMRKYGM